MRAQAQLAEREKIEAIRDRVSDETRSNLIRFGTAKSMNGAPSGGGMGSLGGTGAFGTISKLLRNIGRF
jgi:hypothetical protein